MQEMTPLFLSGLTIGLVQVVKQLDIPYANRLMPLVSLGFGIGLSLGAGLTFIEGLMVGASAAGTYDLVKRTALGIR